MIWCSKHKRIFFSECKDCKAIRLVRSIGNILRYAGMAYTTEGDGAGELKLLVEPNDVEKLLDLLLDTVTYHE